MQPHIRQHEQMPARDKAYAYSPSAWGPNRRAMTRATMKVVSRLAASALKIEATFAIVRFPSLCMNVAISTIDRSSFLFSPRSRPEGTEHFHEHRQQSARLW